MLVAEAQDKALRCVRVAFIATQRFACELQACLEVLRYHEARAELAQCPALLGIVTPDQYRHVRPHLA